MKQEFIGSGDAEYESRELPFRDTWFGDWRKIF